ncbi:MAG TPA: triose-phosphate isomerase [Lentisphaeria bacterium]|jgi:triosephosphate isomerase|nr:triose-phosphate isomerase [Lentisphaeria bacterium]
MARTLIIAGNWKLNHTAAQAKAMVAELKDLVADVTTIDMVLCPTFTVISSVAAAAAGSSIAVGAQNIHWAESGAFTGELNAEMLKDAGATYAIIGHSERRQYFGETDQTVSQRLRATLDGGLKPIVCIGETLEQREADETNTVLATQLDGGLAGLSADEVANLVLAYEPVWAIGTGKTASPQQAQDTHAFIRSHVAASFGDAAAAGVRIQYGGSVKPGNAAELMGQPDIDGALVGGASLKAADFSEILHNSQT